MVLYLRSVHGPVTVGLRIGVDASDARFAIARAHALQWLGSCMEQPTLSNSTIREASVASVLWRNNISDQTATKRRYSFDVGATAFCFATKTVATQYVNRRRRPSHVRYNSESTERRFHILETGFPSCVPRGSKYQPSFTRSVANWRTQLYSHVLWYDWSAWCGIKTSSASSKSSSSPFGQRPGETLYVRGSPAGREIGNLTGCRRQFDLLDRINMHSLRGCQLLCIRMYVGVIGQ